MTSEAREAFEATLGNANGDEPGSSFDDPAYLDALDADPEAGNHPEPDRWSVVDLQPAWDGQRVKPTATVLTRSDNTTLFLPGINYMFGDSGDGKSWVAVIAAAQLITAGCDVVWITYEDPNEDELVERLKQLGAKSEDVTAHFHVVIATEPLTYGIGWLGRLTRRTNAALVVIDSTGEACAVEGIDEDRDADWGPWARRTFRHLIDVCADPNWDDADNTATNNTVAIWPIDHATKAKDNPFFPSGTKRKRAAVTGLMVLLNVRQMFARGQIGRVQLVTAKDRSGRFRRGEIIAEITLDATEEPYSYRIDPPPAGTAMVTGRKRKADERVLQVLEESSVALDPVEIHRLVNDDTTKLPGEGDLTLGTVKNTMTHLAKRPNVTRHTAPTGPGGKAFRVSYSLEESANP